MKITIIIKSRERNIYLTENLNKDQWRNTNFTVIVWVFCLKFLFLLILEEFNILNVVTFGNNNNNKGIVIYSV